MRMKRQKMSPFRRVEAARDRALKRIDEQDEQLAACREELRKMTLRKDGLINMLEHVRLRNLTLLEDYHDLASDVLREQKTRNMRPMGHDGVKDD